MTEESLTTMMTSKTSLPPREAEPPRAVEPPKGAEPPKVVEPPKGAEPPKGTQPVEPRPPEKPAEGPIVIIDPIKKGAVADTPSLSAPEFVSVLPARLTELTGVSAALNDQDGKELLSVTLSNAAAGTKFFLESEVTDQYVAERSSLDSQLRGFDQSIIQKLDTLDNLAEIVQIVGFDALSDEDRVIWETYPVEIEAISNGRDSLLEQIAALDKNIGAFGHRVVFVDDETESLYAAELAELQAEIVDSVDALAERQTELAAAKDALAQYRADNPGGGGGITIRPEEIELTIAVQIAETEVNIAQEQLATLREREKELTLAIEGDKGGETLQLVKDLQAELNRVFDDLGSMEIKKAELEDVLGVKEDTDMAGGGGLPLGATGGKLAVLEALQITGVGPENEQYQRIVGEIATLQSQIADLDKQISGALNYSQHLIDQIETIYGAPLTTKGVEFDAQEVTGLFALLPSSADETQAIRIDATATEVSPMADEKALTATATAKLDLSTFDARDDTAATQEDSAVVIDILANDSFARGYVGYAEAQNGTVNIIYSNPDNIFTGTAIEYTPDEGFTGVDQVFYILEEITADPLREGITQLAEVAVTVNALNNAPVATAVDLGQMGAPDANGIFTWTITASELLAGASDVDGDPLSVDALAIASGGGTLQDNGDQTWTYTRSASDLGPIAFSYTVSDGDLEATSTATLEMADVVGELGEVSLDHNWKSVSLDNSFDDAVVVAFVTTNNGSQIVETRIKDVTADGFDIRLQEAGNHDDFHAVEDVSYIVMEAGRHEVADGVFIEAGTVDTNDVFQSTRKDGQTDVSFAGDFDDALVFTSTNTHNGSAFVTSRANDVASDGFKVSLAEAESDTGGHATESVGWLAVENGSNSVFSASELSVDHNWASTGSEVDFAQLNSIKGVDPGVVRADGANNRVYVQEDTSRDSEVRHAFEDVAVINFFDDSGLLFA